MSQHPDNMEFPIHRIKLNTAFAELTSNDTPDGWPGPDRPPATARSGKTALKAKRTTLRKPRHPARDGKWIRYAKGLLDMVLRPTVMRNYPVHLQLEPTDACNLNCTTCSRDVIVGKASVLKPQYWQAVIGEVRPSNVNVSGIGEPFLSPDILEIVSCAKRIGATVNCATNFTRLHDNHRRVVECGIDQLKISIDATNRETFRQIRGEDSWLDIVENIREVNRWKKALGSEKPELRFNFAVQSLNYLQSAELVELAKELHVDTLYYQHLSYVDMEGRKEFLTGGINKRDLRDQLEEADRRANQHGMQTNLDYWLRDFEKLWNRMQPLEQLEYERKNCYMPWISTWLGADGWIRPCPIMPWTADEGRMGHIGEQSFAEIWNNDKYRELREALKRGERPTRSCKTCCPRDLGNIVNIKSKLLPQ